MDNFYSDLKTSVGMDPTQQESQDDPSLDLVLSSLKDNSTASNFKEFMTVARNQHKPTSWKQIARKVTDDES